MEEGQSEIDPNIRWFSYSSLGEYPSSIMNIFCIKKSSLMKQKEYRMMIKKNMDLFVSFLLLITVSLAVSFYCSISLFEIAKYSSPFLILLLLHSLFCLFTKGK